MIKTKYSWGELEGKGNYTIRSKQYGVVGYFNENTGIVTDKRGVFVDNVFIDAPFGFTDSKSMNESWINTAFSTAKYAQKCSKSNQIPLTVDVEEETDYLVGNIEDTTKYLH